jgi:head-tail adaptor
MTQGLTAAELAQIRADCAELLPDTCAIQAATRTSDGAGGWSDAWTTITGSSAVPCRLDFQNPGKETVSGASNTPFKTGIVTMAYDVTVTTSHRLVINSISYNVTGVNDSKSWIGCKRCAVERVP